MEKTLASRGMENGNHTKAKKSMKNRRGSSKSRYGMRYNCNKSSSRHECNTIKDIFFFSLI